jgi:hypothetical protein
MKFLLPIILIVFTGNIASSKDIRYPDNFYMPIIVDGSILKGSKPILSSYLYIKETEVSNKEYKTFLSWAKSIDKSFYNLAYPDTNVWGKGFEAFRSNYFQSKAFLNMPMVGVSQKQAKLYCSWLQDTYNEYFKTNVDSKIKEENANLAQKAKDFATRIARLGLEPVDVLPGSDLNLIYSKTNQTNEEKREKLKKMNGKEIKK